jgi:hypothetical protein
MSAKSQEDLYEMSVLKFGFNQNSNVRRHATSSQHIVYNPFNGSVIFCMRTDGSRDRHMERHQEADFYTFSL